MRSALFPCTRCHRHYRAEDRACPFCASSPAFSPRARAAIVAAGAALALSACDISNVASAQDEDEPPVRMTPQYGAPDYQPDPPPPPPPSPTNRDAGPAPRPSSRG